MRRRSSRSGDLSRRSFVRFGTVGLLTSAAGCLGSGERDTESDQDTREENLAGQSSLVEEIEFEGQDLVIQLVDGHGISKLNLLDPEGSLYASTSIATGETTVRLQILEIQQGRSSHYTPGEHQLALVSDGSISDTVAINLEPALEITGVQQYRSGERDTDFGKIEVTVQNRGTGPTWVYDTAYQGSPNFAANGELSESYDNNLFTNSTELADLLVLPGESQKYLPRGYPLQFHSEGQQSCDFPSEKIHIIVGSADGEKIQADTILRPDGDSRSVSYNGWYVCTTVAVDLTEAEING